MWRKIFFEIEKFHLIYLKFFLLHGFKAQLKTHKYHPIKLNLYHTLIQSAYNYKKSQKNLINQSKNNLL
jgi:hypothetical protein